MININSYDKFFLTFDGNGFVSGSYPSPSQWDGFQKEQNTGEFLLDTDGKKIPMRPASAVEVVKSDFDKLMSRSFKYVNGTVVAV